MARAKAKWTADEAARVKRDAKNPAAAMVRAREAEQRELMEDDRNEARKDAGEDWADEKEEWIANWIASEWKPDMEEGFIADFKEAWFKDHGAPFPVDCLRRVPPRTGQ